MQRQKHEHCSWVFLLAVSPAFKISQYIAVHNILHNICSTKLFNHPQAEVTLAQAEIAYTILDLLSLSLISCRHRLEQSKFQSLVPQLSFLKFKTTQYKDICPEVTSDLFSLKFLPDFFSSISACQLNKQKTTTKLSLANPYWISQ